MNATHTLLHLSDLHLQGGTAKSVLGALSRALGSANLRPVAAVFVTGDLFDSATLFSDLASKLLAQLVAILRERLATPDLPIVIVPGNHDRRRSGVILHKGADLFGGLADGLPKGVTLAGVDKVQRAQRILLPGLPAIVVAHDSTFLPGGMFSAGGTARPEDYLQIASSTRGDDAALPLIWLTHHHLVPTPVTDFGKVNPEGQSFLARWLVRLLPRLVAYGDREELFMTAMGAGTALSLLHNLARPVLVLHGHKHYPTARILKRTHMGENDVAVVSAGSAGIAEVWRPTDLVKPMRLWPSFNVVEITGSTISIDVIAFPPSEDSSQAVVRRPLLRLGREGMGWTNEPVDAATSPELLIKNEATYRLEASGTQTSEYDLSCKRVVEFARHAALSAVHEVVEGLPGGRIELGPGPSALLPSPVELRDGLTSYTLRRAACSTLRHARKIYGPGTSYEWVGLPNRYGARTAVLRLSADDDSLDGAFGSVTDLTTGRETPASLSRNEEGVTLTVTPCRARTLLRIYWPLSEGEADVARVGRKDCD